MNVIQKALAKLKAGQAMQAGNLAVFPLYVDGNGGAEYLLLDQALEGQVLEITEVGDGGSVAELKVTNKSDEMVLMVEGEQLIGAKQNRGLNASILMAAHSDLVIPVSCTEAGRWSSVSSGFRSSKRHSHPELRRRKSKSVRESLRHGRGHRSDQRGVWHAVHRTASYLGAHSPTSDYEAVHERVEEQVREYADRIELPGNAVGAVVAVNGQIEVADVFDRPETIQRLWGKSIRGYAWRTLDRRGKKAPERKMVDPRAAREFLRRASRAKMERHDGPGVGEDVRMEGERVEGAALVYQGSAVHVGVFPV